MALLQSWPRSGLRIHSERVIEADTSIDLRRSGREPGDALKIRATRYKATEEVDQSSAELELQEFALYARLSPAVVLVAPERLSGGSDKFRFAPILSWLHHYMPRPGACCSDFVSAMRPALGIHAAFLSFDTGMSDAIQVGLGGTLSFWHGRLHLGRVNGELGTRGPQPLWGGG